MAALTRHNSKLSSDIGKQNNVSTSRRNLKLASHSFDPLRSFADSFASILTGLQGLVTIICCLNPPYSRPRRLAWPRTSPFHGGNTGSNPVGDAKSILYG